MSDPTKIVDIEPNVRQWADITIEQFIKKAKALGIHEGALIRSFEAHVFRNAGGDLFRVQVAYLYYGKMVDMGVGRGVKRSDVGSSKRVAKPWFTQTFMHEVAILGHKLAEKLGDSIPAMMTEVLHNQTKIPKGF